MKMTIEERLFRFKQPAGTSRGVYTTRRSWFVSAFDDDGRQTGVGECAPLPQLSCDDIPDYQEVLRGFCDEVVRTGEIPYESLRPYPSMLFGLEQACLQHVNKAFRQGNSHPHAGEAAGAGAVAGSESGVRWVSIPINGLIWMGSFEEMYRRIEEKLAAGFHCVKLKIGAIDWERELSLISYVRERFGRDEVELRVDANGGFSTGEALAKLKQLEPFGIHSIEQPIKAGQWEEMARLCRESPLPIALDEELIGVNSIVEKTALLDTVRPQYLVLKPSLHGGIRGTREWVMLARERGIGSWITSALESNVGLYTIALLAIELYGPDIAMPQGLGTGQLFTDNIPMPLEVRGEKLYLAVES